MKKILVAGTFELLDITHHKTMLEKLKAKGIGTK